MLIQPGETLRFMCDDCSIEYEITLEPKCVGLAEAQNIDPEAPDYCPFCGGEKVAEA